MDCMVFIIGLRPAPGESNKHMQPRFEFILLIVNSESLNLKIGFM